MIEFDVILCGGYFGFAGPAAITRGYVGPLRDDQHISVVADASTTLGGVLEEAAQRFGIEVDSRIYPNQRFLSILHFIAFFKPEHLDPETQLYPHQTHTLVGVTPDGLAHWCAFRDLKCGDLMRAAEAGLIEGDPRRPYLIPQRPAGGTGPAEWHSLLIALRAAWDSASALSPALNAYAVWEIVTKAARRLKPLETAIKRNDSQWTKRGGSPLELARLLSCRAWHAEDLASLLNCSVAEAEALLWGWGYAFDSESNAWRREKSDEADVARYVIVKGMSVPFDAAEGMADELLRAAFKLYATTGRLPSDQELLQGQSDIDGEEGV